MAFEKNGSYDLNTEGLYTYEPEEYESQDQEEDTIQRLEHTSLAWTYSPRRRRGALAGLRRRVLSLRSLEPTRLGEDIERRA
jgi:hypothetical protein